MIKLGLDDEIIPASAEKSEPSIWDTETEIPEDERPDEETMRIIHMMNEANEVAAQWEMHLQKIIEEQKLHPPAHEKPLYRTKGEGWIGVDLDGTIANHTTWKGPEFIGDPIPDMITRVKLWLKLGIEVRILTARISQESCTANNMTPKQMTEIIQDWCEEHIGARLNVVSEKDQFMLFFCDDSAVQVIKNTGKPLSNAGFKVFEDRIRDYLLKHSKEEK